VVAELTCRLETVEVGAGKVFFTEGEPGAWSYIIVSGKVKTGCRTADGRENLFAILGPSDMFGELSTFDPGPRTFTATAVTPVRALLLQHDVLMGWIGERREVAERMMRILARRLRRIDHDLSDLVFTDVGGRVAKQLLRLAQQFGVQDGDFTRVVHDLTQEELAQLVGAKRETVNKALGEFSARGWITLDGRKSRHLRLPTVGIPRSRRRARRRLQRCRCRSSCRRGDRRPLWHRRTAGTGAVEQNVPRWQ
jgi:CRP/FNR family cyclic AMP-dependent transcriptional regulator